jgi:hypothetical protein
MDIQEMDQFKQLALKLVSELPMQKIEDFIKNSGDHAAKQILNMGNFISKQTNDPRYQDITKNFTICLAFMTLDGAYKDQIHYFLNMIHNMDMSCFPCKTPQDWHVNKIVEVV